MEFRVFEDHSRNLIGSNIIGYVISGVTVDKKSNFSAWVVFYLIHVYMFVKRHKSDGVLEIFLRKIKVVEFQMNREFLFWEEYLTCEINNFPINWYCFKIIFPLFMT